MEGCNLSIEKHGHAGLVMVSCNQCGHSEIMDWPVDMNGWKGLCGREQEIVDEICNLPKCYKTGGICRYECGGLCKDSC